MHGCHVHNSTLVDLDGCHPSALRWPWRVVGTNMPCGPLRRFLSLVPAGAACAGCARGEDPSRQTQGSLYITPPQVRPAPRPMNMTLSLDFSIFFSISSSRAMGIVAAVVFPYC